MRANIMSSLALEITPPGYILDPSKPEALQILRIVRDLCGWKRGTFPGSQPISMSNNSIRHLDEMPFVACEKSDGVRYLLLCLSNLVFLIDRKETIHVIDCCLPQPHTSLWVDSSTSESSSRSFKVDPTKLKRHKCVLLDGELVSDNDISASSSSSSSSSPSSSNVRFLVYDCICVGKDNSVKHHNLLKRLQEFYNLVLKPRLAYINLHPEMIEEEKRTNNFLDIYLKDFFEIWDIPAVLNLQNRLPHASDGIIFTAVNVPYIPGTCEYIIKWKPPHLNTIDFAADVLFGYSNEPGHPKIPCAVKLNVGKRGMRQFNGIWLVTEGEMWKKISSDSELVNVCDGQVWECFYDEQIISIALERIADSGSARDMIAKCTHEIKSGASMDTGGSGSAAKRIRETSESIPSVKGTAIKKIKTDLPVSHKINAMKSTFRQPEDDQRLSDELSSHSDLKSSDESESSDDESPKKKGQKLNKKKMSSGSFDNFNSMDIDYPTTIPVNVGGGLSDDILLPHQIKQEQEYSSSSSTQQNDVHGDVPPTNMMNIDETRMTEEQNINLNLNLNLNLNSSLPIDDEEEEGKPAEQRMAEAEQRLFNIRKKLACPILEDRSKTTFYSLDNPVFSEGGWLVERVRTDKKTPNDESVVLKVKASILDGISFEVLMSHILEIESRKNVGSQCKMPDFYETHGSRRKF